MKLRPWALGGVLLLLVGLALACASGSEHHEKHTSAPVSEPDSAFPPTGPIVLKPLPPPPDGTLYQLTSIYDGRTEVTEDSPGGREVEAQSIDEGWAIEIDYRQLPVQAPDEDLASSLVLEALKRRAMMRPPGQQHVLEIGDDRLRVMTDDKVGTDLRGAQPKQDLTPRSVLGKSFATLVTDTSGNPKGFTLRGVPTVKKLLGSLVPREPITYMQIAFPDHPVTAGDTWHAKRFFPNPVGRLGLAVDIELRLVGFEKIGDARCAQLSMRAAMDDKDVKSESGFKFDEVRYTLSGNAWLDMDRGEVVLARIEDVVAAAYHRSGGAMVPTRVRMRYQTRSGLQRLDAMPDSAKWADGTKRFSAVK